MPKEVPYTVQGRAFEGHLADGSGGQPAPGILVLHEANGLSPFARQKADQFAALGYVAYAPDLFGEFAETLERCLELVHQFTEDWEELRTRCTAALEALRAQPNVDKRRIAAVGFCFGGQAALELGRTGADLSAIVGLHLVLATRRPEDSANIKAKVLICMGDQDPFVPRDARNNFMDNMAVSGVDCQLLLFSGVGHGFSNPEADASQIPGVKYDAKATRRAWEAMDRVLVEAFE